MLRLLHENLAFMSDELVELDNGLLTRSMTPYARLDADQVKIASANMKQASKIRSAIRKSILPEELKLRKGDGDEEEDEFVDLHQLGKIFRIPHLSTPALKSKFEEVFLQLDEILHPLGSIVTFQERMAQGHEMLRSCGEDQDDKVNQWKMEATRDPTFDLLNSLINNSLKSISKLLQGGEIPYKSQQIEMIRFKCIDIRGDDGQDSMVLFLKDLIKNNPKENNLVKFKKKPGKIYNPLFL